VGVPVTVHRVAGGATEVDVAAARLFGEFLRRTHLCPASELAAITAEEAAVVGWQELVLYLLDYEQEFLRPVPSVHAADRAPLGVESTVAGRAFTSATVLASDAPGDGHRRMWVPLIDGTDKIGVLEMLVPSPGGGVPPGTVLLAERFAHLVAQMVISKGAYGDVFEYVRRTRPMTVASELQWNLLPPTTFATSDVVLSAMLEPSYDNGGDCFDYAVNGSTVHFVVFDAMGHGLDSAGVAAVALAAYRRARRTLADLRATYRAVDAAVLGRFDGERFATGLLAELDCETGELRWVSAGHPPPLLLRRGKLVKTLDVEPSVPMGVPFGDGPVVVGHEGLEPGDRVLVYTDGLPEARQPDGTFFGLRRLAEFVERGAAAGLPAPETLRRLRHDIVAHQRGKLTDDATALLLEWRLGAEEGLLPETARGVHP
jgi:serine phosphatase RsbU (regulator of sigma subunit)